MSTPYRVTPEFWDHATLWTGDEHDAGHTTDGGRVFGITRTRYAECDDYGCSKVVVIDPEDTTQVERLVLYLDRECDWFGMGENTTIPHMQEALRSLLAPEWPKPAEPTGLGAVVKDGYDVEHVRTSAHVSNPWVSSADGKGRHWDGIDAVRVLSEGVTT